MDCGPHSGVRPYFSPRRSCGLGESDEAKSTGFAEAMAGLPDPATTPRAFFAPSAPSPKRRGGEGAKNAAARSATHGDSGRADPEYPHWHMIVDLVGKRTSQIEEVLTQTWLGSYEGYTFDLQELDSARDVTNAFEYFFRRKQYEPGTRTQWIREERRLPRAYSLFGDFHGRKGKPRQSSGGSSDRACNQSSLGKGSEIGVAAPQVVTRQNCGNVGERLVRCGLASEIYLIVTHGDGQVSRCILGRAPIWPQTLFVVWCAYYRRWLDTWSSHCHGRTGFDRPMFQIALQRGENPHEVAEQIMQVAYALQEANEAEFARNPSRPRNACSETAVDLPLSCLIPPEVYQAIPVGLFATLPFAFPPGCPGDRPLGPAA